ncbi:hypothetical protein V2J09_015931 [Rumex salicifolius]
MAARRYEEMGSSYPRLGGDSSSRSSSDSLNGLKFGHKIYFGDVGLGVSDGGGSTAAATPGKKGRGPVQSGQPPRCQVEGCDVDLTDAKAYYSRHKVCCMHSKSSTVIVGGIKQRFCQQCSSLVEIIELHTSPRFHQLAEFDSEKRSCRRRLAGHNERRRKPPPGSLLSTRLGRLSPSAFDGSSSSSTGFLVDFTASLKAPEQSSWPGTKAHANHSSGKFLQGAWPGGPHPGEMYQVGTTYQVGVGPSIPSGECFAGVTDSSCALSLLSNQDWSSVNRAPPPPPPCSLLNTGGGQSSGHFSGSLWGYKVGEASHDLQADLGSIGQLQHHPLSSRAAGDELDMAQPGGAASGRQLVEFEHSGSYGSSTDHMNWLL